MIDVVRCLLCPTHSEKSVSGIVAVTLRVCCSTRLGTSEMWKADDSHFCNIDFHELIAGWTIPLASGGWRSLIEIINPGYRSWLGFWFGCCWSGSGSAVGLQLFGQQ